MSTVSRDYHLLVIDDQQGKRSFQLSAATHTLGRDASDSVQIYDPSVSRHHALLLRVPAGYQKYSYRIVDGDASGKPSTNGITVNGVNCKSKSLESGDIIKAGETTIQYLIEQFTPEEFEWHFQNGPTNYQSIKEQVVDPTATMMTQLLAKKPKAKTGQ